jgi:hypothetical protein
VHATRDYNVDAARSYPANLVVRVARCGLGSQVLAVVFSGIVFKRGFIAVQPEQIGVLWTGPPSLEVVSVPNETNSQVDNFRKVFTNIIHKVVCLLKVCNDRAEHTLEDWIDSPGRSDRGGARGASQP